MWDVFKSWKRKLGILTLCWACVFAGLWIRGLSLRDRLIINRANHSIVLWFNNQLVSSTPGMVAGLYVNRGDAKPVPRRFSWDSDPNLTAESVAKNLKLDAESRKSPEWTAERNWERKLFGFIIFGATNRTLVFVPYWSIVIPLTLLSAWLLLSTTNPVQRVAMEEALQQ